MTITCIIPNDSECLIQTQTIQFTTESESSCQANNKVIQNSRKTPDVEKYLLSSLRFNKKYRTHGKPFSIVAKLILFIIVFIIMKYYFLKQPEHEEQGIVGLCLSSIRLISGFTRKEIQLADGFIVPYLEGGSNKYYDTNNVLVLLHGFGVNKDSWLPFASFLSPKMKVIIPDIAGFGATVKDMQGDYRADKQAERLAMFFEALHLKSAHIGGSSMGGCIAAVFVAKYPTQVESLWLIASAGTIAGRQSDALTHYDHTGKAIVLIHNYEEFRTMITYMFHRNPLYYMPHFILDIIADVAIKNIVINKYIYNSVINVTYNFPQRILDSGYQKPILILWGDKDRVMHVSGAEEINSVLVNATTRIMKNVGHIPMVEKAQETALEYLQFRNIL